MIRTLPDQSLDKATETSVGIDDDVYVFPTSFAQQRLWFLDQLAPGSAFYNIPFAVRLKGPLHVRALERSVQEIVRRHETLRTTFASRDGLPVQVIAPVLTVSLPVVDLRLLHEDERKKEVQRLADEEAGTPFDLEQGPLLRIRLLKTQETEHVVLLTMHHIISDGWSVNVFIGEMGALYEAFSSGRRSPLPAPPVQYADFALWQRERLSGENLEKQIRYWKDHLGGTLPVLELPTDRPRPAEQAFHGAALSSTIPKEIGEDLHALALQENATLFMVLLAAFQVLLHRYTGQEDICIGAPIANRNRAEIEGLIGFFVNTLVLRVDLGGEPTFRDLLRRVRKTTLKAYESQDVPFEMVVEAVRPERDASYNPLFQAMFILQNAAAGTQEVSGLKMEMLEAQTGTSTFDLTLSISETFEGLDASVEYNTDLFDRSTMERFLERFHVLLKGIAAGPDLPITDLPVQSDRERDMLLFEWNRTARPFLQPDACIHRLFEAQVDRTPDSVAAAALGNDGRSDGELSYRELNRRANQLARHLGRLGVGPETVVGVRLKKSTEILVGILGVLKAGGAYLALDPDYPAERQRHMIEDCGVQVILTMKRNEEIGNRVEEEMNLDPCSLLLAPRTCVLLDADWPAIAEESEENPAIEVDPENLAYIVYTSGSTGKPKGAMVRHRNLVNAYRAWEEAYGLPSVHNHLQMANCSFDVFSGDLVRALCSGGKLVLCPLDLLLDSQKLYGLMQEQQIECAEFVPAVLRDLMERLGRAREDLDFMRLLICGSDVWYGNEYDECGRFLASQARLINSFGLAEATIDSSYFEVRDCALPKERIVPIGRPFANTRMYVLDRRLRPQPVGVPGELFIGGAGVARGYFNRAELTAERFVPDSFETAGDQPPSRREDERTEDRGQKTKDREPDQGGKRLYRTGDLARFLPDGNVEFLGRMDHQIKIRGFRIETGEIESTLKEYPAVQDAVVIAVKCAEGAGSGPARRLAAYLVPRPETDLSIADLRIFMKARLPDYMIPSAFIELACLPLSPNGKVDRKALPPPDWSSCLLQEDHVAPRTPVEEMLAVIWAELLEVERVGVHDNFFDLGGHSLLATQLVSRVRTMFQVEIPLRVLFERPTLEEFAQPIEVAMRAGLGVKAPPIIPVPRGEDLPLSFSQQRLWFLDQLEPGSPLYNLPEIVRLSGRLDIPVLDRCLNESVRRHESLRTGFKTVDGKPFQDIHLRVEAGLPVADLKGLPAKQREEEVQRLVREEMERPFDLTRPPLFRARILRLEEEEHVFVLVMHHIIGDDWSTSVLVQEIATSYDALSKGSPCPLPELEVQYADFALWQRSWMQGEVLQTHLDYWKGQLADLPPLLELPTDRPRSGDQANKGDYRTFALSAPLCRSMRELCRKEGVTLFMFLLGAFHALLYRYSGQETIAVGSPIANRNRAEVEGLIGFFVNTLVLRADLSGEITFRELLRQEREATLNAYAHQDLPFEMIVDALQPVRDLSHSPLFQVMFALQNTPIQSRALPDSGLTLGPVEAHSGTAKFDLTLFMIEEGDGLGGAMEYDSALFNASTVQRMISHFEAVLSETVRNPDIPLSQIRMLSEGERRQMLLDWNDARNFSPHSRRCAHEMFEAQALLTPDAIASTHLDQNITYQQLNLRSNQLARYLKDAGVGTESLAGLCVERSLEMVVGILGILKAGGAYVPLDPSYPDERLSYMVEDSEIGILLTQEKLRTRCSELRVETRNVLCLDADWPMIAGESDEDPVVDVSPSNLAYVIYTSGSTGKPKGAMITHEGLVNYLCWTLQAYPLDAGQGSPLHSSISFDLTVTSLFAPLISGTRVLLLSQEAGVEALGNAMESEADFSLIKITPAHLQAMGEQSSAVTASSRTKAFIIGGENLLSEQIAFWQSFAPETALVNEYGPTETVVGCCVYWTPADGNERGVVPIGRPIINTRLYALDPSLNPVPVGVSGELFIAGPGLARGYLKRPGQTAERFVPDPFAPSQPRNLATSDSGGRLYRTGDLVRYLPDGNLDCLGRLDHQVKIRGFRVELGEIEAVLGQHHGVREAVVWPYEERGRKRLAAYVVPDEKQGPLNPSELRDFLLETLPDYMVPSAFVILERLPLTSHGKVDRKKLPTPGAGGVEAHEDFVAPRNAMERILAGIWANLLGVEKVGIHDNFFELGGDSILSIQLVSRASREGIRLTPRQIFEVPTIAGLIDVADTSQAKRADQSIVTGPVPLTPIQRWFFGMNLAEPHHWNQSLILKLNEPLEPAGLRTTLNEIIRHHDALRLRFRPVGTDWEQVDAPPDAEPPLTWIDLSELDAEARRQELETVSNEAQPGLDLSRGPLIRFIHFDMGGGDAGWVLILMHHLITDAVSWQILIEDFQAAYRDIHSGRAPGLPAKTTSFRDWAHTLASLALSEDLIPEVDYWASVSAGLEYRLPVDHPDGENVEASSLNVVSELGIEETAALLHDLPRATGAGIHEVLLTALAWAVFKWTGKRETLIDMEGHGREHISDAIDLTRTVGWFTALYPLRLSLGEAAHPGEALQIVRRALRQVPRNGLGYGILRHLSGQRPACAPLQDLPSAELSFNYFGQMEWAGSGAGQFGFASPPTGTRSPGGRRTHLIDVNGGVVGGRLLMEWCYSGNLHRPSTMQLLADDFIEALRSIIKDAGSHADPVASDFQLFGWDQSELDDILSQIERGGP